MPTYIYKIKKKSEKGEFIEELVEVNHSYKCLEDAKLLPKDVLEKIQYVNESGETVLGDRVLSSPYLGGFNEYGSSKSTKSSPNQ